MRWWTRWPMAVVAVVLVVLGVWKAEVERSSTENKCRMTYMFPSYTVLPRPQHERYRLVVYRERARPFRPRGKPLLFIPGHLGSYEQVRSLGSLLDVVPARGSRLSGFDVFAIDFQEEPSGISGYVLEEQQDYVNDCIAAINRLYLDAGVKAHPLVVIGHSMGGILALAAARITAPFAHTISTVITLATPLARPPLSYYPQLSRAYAPFRGKRHDAAVPDARHTLTPAPQLLSSNTTVVVVSGGARDRLVPPALTLPAAEELALHTFDTTRMPEVLVSTDHLCILWCNQLVRALTAAIATAEQRTTVAGAGPSTPTLTEGLYLRRFSAHVPIPAISKLEVAPTALRANPSGASVKIQPQPAQRNRVHRGIGTRPVTAAVRLHLSNNHLVMLQDQQQQHRQWQAEFALEAQSRPATLNVSLCRPVKKKHSSNSSSSSSSNSSDGSEPWELMSSRALLSEPGGARTIVTLNVSDLSAVRTIGDATLHLASARVVATAPTHKTDGSSSGLDNGTQHRLPQNLHLCVATSNPLTITPLSVQHQQPANAHQGGKPTHATPDTSAAPPTISDAVTVHEVQPPLSLLGLVAWCYQAEVVCGKRQECARAVLAQQRVAGFGTWGSALPGAEDGSRVSVAFCDEFPEAARGATVRLLVWPAHESDDDDPPSPQITVSVDGIQTLAQNAQRMLHVLPVVSVSFGVAVLAQLLFRLLRSTATGGAERAGGSASALHVKEEGVVMQRASVWAAAVAALLSTLCVLDALPMSSANKASTPWPVCADFAAVLSWGTLVFAAAYAFVHVAMEVVMHSVLRALRSLFSWLGRQLTRHASSVIPACVRPRAFITHAFVLLILLLFPAVGWLVALLLLLLPLRLEDSNNTMSAFSVSTTALVGWVSLGPALLEDGAHAFWRLQHMQAPVPRYFWMDVFHSLVLLAWLLVAATRTQPVTKPKRL